MSDLDVEEQLSSGQQAPEAIFSEIADIVEAAVTTPVSTSDALEKNYSGLVTGSRTKKDLFGTFKTPKAARISVLDLSEPGPRYIATSTQFLLTGVNRQRQEKWQAIYGFDEEFMFSSFGQDIPVYRISGGLLNMSGDKYDWTRNMHQYYEDYLRAKRLVQLKRVAVLHYSNRWVRGYPVRFTENETAQTDTYSTFSIDLVVRRDRFAGRTT